MGDGPHRAEHLNYKKNTKEIAYVCDDSLLKLCDSLPKLPGRASAVHGLLQAYQFVDQMRLVSPHPVRQEELLLFHSLPYIDCLKRLSDTDDDEKYDEEADQFGLTYDCPAFPGVFEYACGITGATVRAAQCLVTGLVTTAIQWTGGWHHAKRDEASGFCYLNDIVIAILKLREKFERVLYIDIDLHHGDGVEDAFCATHKVMTVSFHKLSPGFFPGTGQLTDIGIGKGKYYTVNVPLKDGTQDEQFVQIFQRVMKMVHDKFEPQAVVCQCGADGVVGDPMNSFNLTTQAYVGCVQYIKDWKLPLLLVGGGGYHIANTARCWAAVTACVLDEQLPEDIPEHKYFPLYGPDYSLSLSPGNRPNYTTPEHVDAVISQIEDNMKQVHV